MFTHAHTRSCTLTRVHTHAHVRAHARRHTCMHAGAPLWPYTVARMQWRKISFARLTEFKVYDTTTKCACACVRACGYYHTSGTIILRNSNHNEDKTLIVL